MKIQIITIHRLNNFGSTFQAYALYKYLSDELYDVEIIDYHPRYFLCPSIKTRVGQMIYRKEFKDREVKFKRFVEGNIKLTKRKYSSYGDLSRLIPSADVYMVGSDQLWNYHYDCGKDDSYKLTFCNGVKVSYGTSLGKNNFTNEELNDLRSKISDYKFVSVRESKSVDVLKSIGIDAYWVVDPVLLLDRHEYQKFTIKPTEDKYAFVYLVSTSNILIEAIELLSSRLGLKIIVYSGLARKCKCDKQLRNLGPEEALSYIVHAEFILSASFHATLFSVMFKKNFATLLPGVGSNERIEDLLSWTNLHSRIIYDKNDLERIFSCKPNYKKEMTDIINGRILKSKEMLKDVLKAF